MSEALPRIGWIDNAHGVRQRDTVTPRVSAAELDRLAMLLGDVRCGANAAEWAPPESRLRYLRSCLRPAKATKSMAALLALLATTAVISQFATKSSHDLASSGSLAARGKPAAFESSRSRGDGAMRGSVVAGVLSAGLLAGSALAQDAVQWRVEDGGNGHWYGIAFLPETNFGTKVQYASALNARLATIGSASENEFIKAVGVGANLTCRLVIGAQRSCSTCAWIWLDQSRWGYSNWGISEPDTPGAAHAEMFIGFGMVGKWADVADDDGSCPSVLLEWSADCNGDGVVDFGQIRAGELDDANANNIPDCCEQGVACDCPADIDGSGAVNAIDLAIVIGYWGTDGGKDYPQADIDSSGEIDGADLATLLGSWGACE
jgi:hypothetical protein